MTIAKFTWLKPTAGHVWSRDVIYENRKLIPVSGSWAVNRKRAREQSPTTPDASLFRKFIQLPAVFSTAHERAIFESEIKAFADDHGDIHWRPNWSRGSGFERIQGYATAQTWSREIENMRRVVAHWDKFKYERQKGLWVLLNEKLMDTETPNCATPMLVNGHLVLYPNNLLAFMWLTLARVVSGDIKEQRCTGFDIDGEQCRRFIYFEAGVRRYDPRATCSDVCRKRKQRPKV